MKLIITILIIMGLQAHSEGGQETGGGFVAFSNEAFNTAKRDLSTSFTSIPGSIFENWETGKPLVPGKPIDSNEFKNIISNIRLNLGGYSKTRVNPDGDIDLLDMNYGVDPDGTKYIEVLDAFFFQPNSTDEEWIKRKIIHETLHHYGYNEHQSRIATSTIINRLKCYEKLLPLVDSLEDYMCISMWEDETTIEIYNSLYDQDSLQHNQYNLYIPREEVGCDSYFCILSFLKIDLSKPITNSELVEPDLSTTISTCRNSSITKENNSSMGNYLIYCESRHYLMSLSMVIVETKRGPWGQIALAGYAHQFDPKITVIPEYVVLEKK